MSRGFQPASAVEFFANSQEQASVDAYLRSRPRRQPVEQSSHLTPQAQLPAAVERATGALDVVSRVLVGIVVVLSVVMVGAFAVTRF